MRRKETIKTYGRHRMRVVSVDQHGWSSDDDRHKDIFSFSNSGCSSEDSSSVGKRITRSTRKHFLLSSSDKENRNSKRAERGRKFQLPNPSDSDSEFTRKGLYDATNRITRSSVKTNKTLFPNSTSKSTAKSAVNMKKEVSYNFSEIEDYSLIVDSDDSKPKKTAKKNILKSNHLHLPEPTNVDTSTPCREANIKINNCDISQIAVLEDSPIPAEISVSCHGPLCTSAPTLNLSSIADSPSFNPVSEISGNRADIEPMESSCSQDSQNDPIYAPSISERIKKRTRNQIAHSPISNRTRSVYDQTESLFDSPDLSKAHKIPRTGRDELSCFVNVSQLRESFIREKLYPVQRGQNTKSLFESTNSSTSSRNSHRSASPVLARETTLDEITENNMEFESDDESEKERSANSSHNSPCSESHEFSREVTLNDLTEDSLEYESDDYENEEDDQVESSCFSVILEESSESTEDEDNTDPENENSQEKSQAENESQVLDSSCVDKLDATRYLLTEQAIIGENESWQTGDCYSLQSSMESSEDVGTSTSLNETNSESKQSKHSLRVISMDESSTFESPYQSKCETDLEVTTDSYHTANDESNKKAEDVRITKLKCCDHLNPCRSPVASSPVASSPVGSPANLSRSFVDMLTPKRTRDSDLPVSPRSKILTLCDNQKIISFKDAIPQKMLNGCVKIGEGVYGEVFRATRNQKSVAIKIVPIEGDFLVNDEKQKTFEEVVPEVLISQELSSLRYNKVSRTDHFCQVNSVSCVKGAYPKELLKQWDEFNERKVSENDRPDIFNDNQLFIVFEFADAGCDLQSFKCDSPAQTKSILLQASYALAVAEELFEFEHRDLHIGNVLVRETDESTLTCRVGGQNINIKSCGIHVCIIDFTMSRLKKDGVVIHCNLAEDETLFQGKGDYQFDIYRLMKEHNGNKWKDFQPYSNILWIHYLTDYMLKKKRYTSNTRLDREVLKDIRQFYKDILDYDSARQLVLETDFFKKS